MMGSNSRVLKLQPSRTIRRRKYHLYADLEESRRNYSLFQFGSRLVPIIGRRFLLAGIPTRIESMSSIVGDSIGRNLQTRSEYGRIWNKYHGYIQYLYHECSKRSHIRNREGMGGVRYPRIHFGERTPPQDNRSGKRIGELIIRRKGMVREWIGRSLLDRIRWSQKLFELLSHGLFEKNFETSRILLV
jgi:hypothetical protein